MNKKQTIVICGGGASGFFTAINLAERRPGHEIIILEKSNKVLSKVRVSGGGRCNVTNGRIHPSELIKHYPRGGKKLYKLFEAFSTEDMRHWLRKRHVATHVEEDLRVFPVSNSSETIINCFMEEIRKRAIQLRMGDGLKQIKQAGNEWKITTTQGNEITAKAVVIATGASPQVWNILSELGIEIKKPVPSLFTFKISSPVLSGLQGISFPNVQCKVVGTTLSSEGPLLITHWGLSGPAILKLSAWGARTLASSKYSFDILINFISSKNPETCRQAILSYKSQHGKRTVFNYPLFDVPKRFWESICQESGIGPKITFAELGKKSINKLTQLLTQAPFHVEGKSTFKEEFVTCGGVALSEINLETFESKKYPSLYFTGEVLDIDAITGGFNFQACWSSAWQISQNL